ncbi:branched-chain amino acid ABC transporter permease [Rhodopseudomonas palustris]|uniref:branched-chain amino acid ABC transporter permease n=1 Tax=Rhodopseudomonas sp. TaxID=1078 RepID=UPI0024C82716|nr:branched-chain amino acid ABC transporter permease [Rhodopseudomonas palustris]
MATLSVTAAPSAWAGLRNDLIAAAVIAVLGAIGYFVYPDDLAFLIRVIGLAFLVISLDLVTGYCGVATLGHAALFGVGAYAAGNFCLAGVTDPILMLLIGALAGTATGLVSGLLVTRFRGLPQLVLSIAFGQLVAALANKLSSITGGSDGLAGISPSPVFGIFNFDMFGRTGYVFSVIVLLVTMVTLLRFARSPFALMCRAIKDDTLRTRMIGVSVYPRLVVMYCVAGAVAGLGGALTAINTGVVGLDSVGFERSAEALIMLILGGAGNLWGALIGAILFELFHHYVSTASPFHWMILVGVLLIVVVLFFPKGLVNEVTRRIGDFRQARAAR